MLRLLELGRSTEQIARELHLSIETVRNHIRHLMRALNAHSRLEADRDRTARAPGHKLTTATRCPGHIRTGLRVPEIFNPAGDGEPGKPVSNGPGLVFGGTCTVTAT